MYHESMWSIKDELGLIFHWSQLYPFDSLGSPLINLSRMYLAGPT